MRAMSRSVAAGTPEPQSQEFAPSVNSSVNFTFRENVPTNMHMLSEMNQSNRRSPRIAPDMHFTDMDLESFPFDAKKSCPDDECLSKSRSLTPVQVPNYDSLPLLDKALSESAKQYPEDFIDPVAYACRSVEERRQKSIEEGKVSRPLNSYMLYRKAYQQVARRVIRKDQQQSASQTVGTSWTKLERDEIKSKFRALAKIDHEKHLEAFPTYRYTPTQGKASRGSSESKKTTTTARKSCRRPGQRNIHPSTKTKQASIPTGADAVLSGQSHNSGSDWWFRERQEYATPFSHMGSTYDGYEYCGMPDSGYFGVAFPDEVAEHSTGHSTRQITMATPGTLEVFDFDHFIDPSLWSRFEGNNSQWSVPYMQWQGRNGTTGQLCIPDTTLNNPTLVKNVKHEG